jgi:Leucine-rich repeat (LRR) protein
MAQYVFKLIAADKQNTANFDQNSTDWTQLCETARTLADCTLEDQSEEYNGVEFRIAILTTPSAYLGCLDSIERTAGRQFPKLTPKRRKSLDNGVMKPFAEVFGAEPAYVPPAAPLMPIDDTLSKGRRIFRECKPLAETKASPAAHWAVRLESEADATYFFANIDSFRHIHRLVIEEGVLGEKPLPAELAKLRCLDALHIQENTLPELPREIGYLTALKVFLIGQIGLEAFPATLGELQDLRWLEAPLNCLAELPDSIGNLRKLRKLNVYGNQDIAAVPDSIGSLTELFDLDLGYNQIASLPTSFGQLQKLEILALHECQKLDLATGAPLAALGNLRTLDIASVPGIPETQVLPAGLEKLIWDWTSAAFVPDWVGELTSLQQLSMKGLAAPALPDGLSLLVNLENLDLEGAEQLVCLPQAMGGMKELKTLNLTKAKALKTLPLSFGKLTSLESLVMNEAISFEVFPPTIQTLTSLESLEMSGGNRGAVPTGVGVFPALRELTLNRQGLVTLPPELAGLAALETLNLQNNRLRRAGELLPVFSGIAKLEDVDLSANPITLFSPETEALEEKLESVMWDFDTDSAADNYRTMAAEMVEQGDYPGGAGIVKEICGLAGIGAPTEGDIAVELARAFRTDGKWQLACGWYQRAIANGITDDRAFKGLFACLGFLKDPQKTLSALETALGAGWTGFDPNEASWNDVRSDPRFAQLSATAV